MFFGRQLAMIGASLFITAATFIGAAEVDSAEAEAARARRAQRQAAADLSRQDIRAMPIVERPSRPGHFYGNTVRRVHHFRHGR